MWPINLALIVVVFSANHVLSEDTKTVRRFQTSKVNLNLSGQWFLCLRGNRVQACRRRKSTRTMSNLSQPNYNETILPVVRTKSCTTQTCIHGSCAGVICICDGGWRGRHCQKDINECKLKKKPCSQRCKNSKGSYSCQCKKKYTLQRDGETCIRKLSVVSQMHNNLSINFHHINSVSRQQPTVGLSNTHPRRYIYDYPSSRLIKILRSLPVTQSTRRRMQSAKYSLDQLLNELEMQSKAIMLYGRRLLATVKYYMAKRSRSLIKFKGNDPCSRVKCRHKCVRTSKNSAKCICNHGYKLDRIKRKCVDINECLSKRKNPCHKNSVCNNKIGSYSCKCKNGYAQPLSGNQTQEVCIDINECLTGEHRCNNNARCLNMPGYHRCECLKGYTGNGIDCEVENNSTASVTNTSSKLSYQATTQSTNTSLYNLPPLRIQNHTQSTNETTTSIGLAALSAKPETRKLSSTLRGSPRWIRLRTLVMQYRKRHLSKWQ